MKEREIALIFIIAWEEQWIWFCSAVTNVDLKVTVSIFFFFEVEILCEMTIV